MSTLNTMKKRETKKKLVQQDPIKSDVAGSEAARSIESITMKEAVPDVAIPWVEKYRPSQFQDIVLDPLNRRLFQNMLDKKYFPHLLFYGPGGTGKTTTVINLINEFQSKYYRVNKSNVIHLNASDERGIDIIRNQIHQFARSLNLFEAGLKFVILDEVDYMTKNAQQALKYILQTSSYNVRFCLICNYITKIDESLKNEFLCIRFNQLPKRNISQFIKNICEKEGLTLNEDVLDTVQEMYQNDIRSMINYLQLEGFRIQNMYTPFHSRILDDLHQQIMYAKTVEEFSGFLHQISIQYNMDKRTILEKFVNHRLRRLGTQGPGDISSSERIMEFLNRVEIIMHRPDIPIDVSVKYLYYIRNHIP